MISLGRGIAQGGGKSLGNLGLDVAKSFVAFAARRVSDEERLTMLDEWDAYLSEWMAERVKTHPDLPELLPPETATSWDTAS